VADDLKESVVETAFSNFGDEVCFCEFVFGIEDCVFC
jgi:hypothetical protein